MPGPVPGASRLRPACTGSSARCPLDGLRAVNVYAIDDGDGVALVDTGWNHPDIVGALTAALGSLERITAIVCTHSHYDHYGLAGPAARVVGRAGAARRARSRRTWPACWTATATSGRAHWPASG